MHIRRLAAALCLAGLGWACDDGADGGTGDLDSGGLQDGAAGQGGGGAGGGGAGGGGAGGGGAGGGGEGGGGEGGAPEDAGPPDQALPDQALPDQALPDQALPDQGPAECAEGAERPCPGDCPQGLQTCAAGRWSECVPPAETCNGADDDCDGSPDEDFVGLGAPCAIGTGACAAEGVNVCTPDGNGVACNAVAANPEPEACDGVDNDCDGATDEGLTRACTPAGGGGVGACAGGVERCVEGGFTACEASIEASPEVCDDVDNDCDGVTDESADGLALTEPCYGGPAGTQEVGTCRGGQRTCEAGVFGGCAGEVLPGVDQCDGLDNDCNGAVDDSGEDCTCEPGTVEPCYTGPAGTQGVGACTGGTRTCTEAGTFGPCDDQRLPEAERCDEVDNDCDGDADEAVPGVGVACAVGLGQCQREGRTRCDGAGARVVCDAAPAAAGPETCDGTDQDCDGETDEGLGLGQGCTVGLGRCQAAGLQICGPAGAVICDARPGAAGVELCNTEDDDCDGQADEGLDLGLACAVGVGACAREGVRVCDAAGQVDCSARPGVPGTEACDGLDNDCDGTLDEGNPGGGQDCDTGVPGICARGLRQCSAGAFTCVQQAVPGAEVCDGLDNDCDGRVDTAANGLALSRACYDGPAGTLGVGPCVGGIQRCEAGSFGNCVGEVQPRPEICDRADNDCNGVVDDVPAGTCVCQPGTTQACYGGPAGTAGVGACRAGTQTCAPDGSGFGACAGEVVPGAEVCDGADNDCNRQVDDLPGVGIACSAGVGACRADGRVACDPATGALACDARPGPPQEERCDNLDNDCNGFTDDVAGLGDRCTGGVGECTAAGNLVCDLNRQTLACNARPGEPSREDCDGRDDDCDGRTDEAVPGVDMLCSVGTGACLAFGRTICAGQEGVICGAAPGAPAPEICDGLDNDCNGTRDDNLTDEGRDCTVGVGVCARPGLTRCSQGGLQCDGTPGAPTGPDLCNDLDDDCDGAVDEGLDCTIYRSCAHALEQGATASGVYVVSASGVAGEARSVYCDQVTDGGGWTLVGSTAQQTLNDQASDWYPDLTTLAPAAARAGVWGGLRPLGQRFDVRFACRAAIGAANAPLTVDLGFYDVPWYTEMTTGTDAESCFSENNGLAADARVPARRNLLTGDFRRRDDPYGQGALEGEDNCIAADDFTVDFDDRGMDGNEGDGTDWGEDDGVRKCGLSGLATGQWFVFVRERPRAAVVGLPASVTTHLHQAGLLATSLNYGDALPGQLTVERFDTVVIGRFAFNWALMTQALKNALDAFGRDGGSVVAEWDGASLFTSQLDPSHRYVAGAPGLLGWFAGRTGAGGPRGFNTPVVPVEPLDAIFANTPNPLQGGNATHWFFWLKGLQGDGPPTGLRTVATIAGAVAGFPDPSYGAVYRGRYCDGNALFAPFDWSDAPGAAGLANFVANLVREANAPPPADLIDQCGAVRRTVLMLCGNSTRNLSTVLPDLRLVEGCVPDSTTQALLVTREGGANVNAATLRPYLDGGGIIITEFSSSDEVFNAVFAPNPAVVQGARVGACNDNIMPTVQLRADDSFWQENRFVATPAAQSGCGHNLAAYPGIRPLGGLSANEVQLAWRDRGPGRVWLVESDWQDNQGNFSPASLGLLRYMITHGGRGERASGQIVSGVQTSQPIGRFLKDGFQICHRSAYNAPNTPIAGIQAACSGEVLLMGCREVDSDMLNVAAMGRRAEVFEDVGTGANAVNLHNGVNWYFNGDWSWGFAPAAEAVNRNPCDSSITDSGRRLCWYTRAGNVAPGFRCGANSNLGADATWERVVLHRNTGVPPAN